MHRGLRLFCAITIACMALVVLAPLAHGQGATGTVNGTVKDAGGGVIPGASVTLKSEAQGIVTAPVLTNERGDFVIPNLTADTYTVQVEMPSFKTAKVSGVSISPGSNIRLQAITLEVGGTAEVVDVQSEGPAQLQTTSGEKSFTIEPAQAAALPLDNRNYFSLLALVPGISYNSSSLSPSSRIGGGGSDTYMVDGLTTMSSGVNRPNSRISSESIAEVKVATFGYGAEYGRSAGNQINAVTKSGSNQFHGSAYDMERHSKFGYANSKINILNGDPKPITDQRDYGWSIGGPIGKPGRNNKLFFFWNQEYNPRANGGAVITRYRMPTPAERNGDFSQTLDQNGALYPYIKDPLISGTCSATSQAACFKDGGVLGKIPANRIWSTGLNILKWWPAPNCPAACSNYAANAAYNFETKYPGANLLGWEPVIRIDYAPTQKLRANFKMTEYLQPNNTIQGVIPGFSDSTEDNFGIYSYSTVVDYTLNSTTFMEGSFGYQTHRQEGCSVSGGDPNFCRSGDATNASANRITAGFGGIPYLFPDATLLDKNTLAYRVMQDLGSKTTVWDGTRVQAAPAFSWGNRVANAPLNWNNPWSSFILEDRNRTGNFSLTKVSGSHTIKGGYQYLHLVQTRGTGAITGSISFANDTANPLDSSFGFANALLGVFSSYSQLSTWGEGAHTQLNHEFFLQDNWKVNQKLTLDYGMRFVHASPGFDAYVHFANFFPDKWSKASAPRLYTYGCDNNVYPCSGTNRRAIDPLTGAFLGTSAQASLIVGTVVNGTGVQTNGLIVSGTNGIPKQGMVYPNLGFAPRVGAAYTVNQRFVVRGAGGVFMDRPATQTTYSNVMNPPFSQNVTVRYGNLQDIATTGLSTQSPPTLNAFQYNQNLPTSIQWNGGVQMKLPASITLDLTYTGQHSHYEQQTVNLNSLDYGTAYQAALQDRTQTANGVTTSLVNANPNSLRSYLGFGSISSTQPTGWHTFHSIQFAFARRLRNGVSFGFNDTLSLYDVASVAPRLQHNSDGTVSIRSDQDQAQKLLGPNHPQTHNMRGNVIWQLPKLTSQAGGMKTLGALVNDWSVASIWSGSTGAVYSAGYTYTSSGASIDITGSPDFGGRVVMTGDPGSGCNKDPLKGYNTAAFQGPVAGSIGLDSGANYLRYCFQSKLDLSLSRTIKLGENGRSIQLRLDAYNSLNQQAITTRNNTIQFANPATNKTPTNLPFDANGNVVGSFSKPNGAGFGVATAVQTPRTMQVQVRFQF